MAYRVFDSHDTDLYSTWHLENGGIVEIIIPDQESLKMSLAKAEDMAASIARQAEYGRWAASRKVTE